MTLSNAILSARSALNASSLGLQIVSNNMANVATPGYTRQVAILKAVEGSQADKFMIGRGVGVADVQRKVDEALNRRLRAGISDEHASAQRVAVFDQLETILNELSDADLSTEITDFFSAWSEATSLLTSRSTVIEQGGKIASLIQSTRQDVVELRGQIELQLAQGAKRADDILSDIAGLNTEIMQSEIGDARANALRDQRDQLVAELSTLVDVSIIEDGQGAIDVLVGSMPVVVAGQSRGIDIRTDNSENSDEYSLVVTVKSDGTPLSVTGGQIGGWLAARDDSLDELLDRLDELAAALIFEVNKLHATGTNDAGLASAESSVQLGLDDRTRAFNDPLNSIISALPFAAENGGFYVNITNSITGSTDRVRVDIDLDSITNAGLPGTDDDTTPQDILDALNAIDGLSAEWTPDGKLRVTAETGYSFSFADDTSGVLGLLGVNSFFEGTSAVDIAVRESLVDDPQSLALGRIVDGVFVENGTAMRIAQLQSTALDGLGERSPTKFWADQVQAVGSRASTARTQATSTTLVRESLEAQRAASAGVSIDEESINLINYQQQYSAAARVIQIADELMDILINIV